MSRPVIMLRGHSIYQMRCLSAFLQTLDKADLDIDQIYYELTIDTDVIYAVSIRGMMDRCEHRWRLLSEQELVIYNNRRRAWVLVPQH